MKARLYCKYGHLKSGENLLLRPRHIEGIRKYPSGNTGTYSRDYVERVCRICLNRQKREWDAKHQRANSYRYAVRQQELAEQKLDRVTDLATPDQEPPQA